MLVTNTSSAC